MSEQDLVIEEAQVEDASSLLALLQKVVEETDFIIQDKVLTLDEMIRFWTSKVSPSTPFVWWLDLEKNS